MREVRMILIIGTILLSNISWAQNDTTEIEVPDNTMIRTVVKKEIVIPKDPTLSALLSAQLPGLGQMYCGKWLKGGIFLISAAALYGIANEQAQKAEDESLSEEEKDKHAGAAIATFVLGLGVHIWNIFDAHKTAEIYNRRIIEQRTDVGKWKIEVAFRDQKAYFLLTKKM